jgi:hypothetical protein
MIWYGVIWHEDMAWICSLGEMEWWMEKTEAKERKWMGGSGSGRAGVEGQKWMGRSGSGRAGVEGRRREWTGGSERAGAGVKGGSGRAEAAVKGQKWMGGR